MRKNVNAETRPRAAKNKGRPFNPYKLELELAHEADRRRERLAPNQFHIVRGVAEGDSVVELMPELDLISKHAGRLAFSYFNVEDEALNSIKAKRVLTGLSEPRQLEVPTVVRVRERSSIHCHVYLAFGDQIKSDLIYDFNNISTDLTSGGHDSSLPNVSPTLGYMRLGRYRDRREAHQAKDMFKELLPETLTLTPPEVLHILR